MNDAQGFLDAKRRMEKGVLRYLITHPESVLKKDNKKILESLLEIEIFELQFQSPELSYEAARKMVQWKCELEAQHIHPFPKFEQEQLDVLHPDQEKNEAYYENLIIAMAMYFCDKK